MQGSCLVCALRPVLWFTTVSSVFANFACQHSSPQFYEQSITPSLRKRIIGIILECVAIVATILELHTIFSAGVSLNAIGITEMLVCVFQFALVIKIIISNRQWKIKIKQYETMIYISDYVKRFNENKDYYSFNYWIFYIMIMQFLIFFHGTYIIQLLVNEKSTSYWPVFKYLCLHITGFLEGSMYIRCWTDMTVHGVFFEKICEQVEKEVNLRLCQPSNVWMTRTITDSIEKVSTETNFLRKLKKLKKLYMLTLSSFNKTKDFLRGPLTILFMQCFLSLIFLFSFLMIWTHTETQLTLDYSMLCIRSIVMFINILCSAYLCDKIQESIEVAVTSLQKIPICKLDSSESKEVEFFTKLLGWEQPMMNSRNEVLSGLPNISEMMIDISINSMVVTQLFYWLEKQK